MMYFNGSMSTVYQLGAPLSFFFSL